MGNIGNTDNVRKLFSKTSIVVIRYEYGKLKMSKPCVNCLETIKRLGIKYVYYSTGNGNEIIRERVENMTSDCVSQLHKNLSSLVI